jgi:hypothetical protein
MRLAIALLTASIAVRHAFRSDIPIHFANHHEAHAFGALFFTD